MGHSEICVQPGGKVGDHYVRIDPQREDFSGRVT